MRTVYIVLISLMIAVFASANVELSDGVEYDHWRQDNWIDGDNVEFTSNTTNTSYLIGDSELIPNGYLAAGIDPTFVDPPPGMKSVYDITITEMDTVIIAGINTDPANGSFTGRLYALLIDEGSGVPSWIDLGPIKSDDDGGNVVVKVTSVTSGYLFDYSRLYIACGVTTADNKGTIYYIEQSLEEDGPPEFGDWQYIGDDLLSHNISSINCLHAYEGEGILAGTSPDGKLVYYGDFYDIFPDPDYYLESYVLDLSANTDIIDFYAPTVDDVFALTGPEGKLFYNNYYDTDDSHSPIWTLDHDFEEERVNAIFDFGYYIYAATGQPARIYGMLGGESWEMITDLSKFGNDVYTLNNLGDLLIAGTDSGQVIASFDHGKNWGSALKVDPNGKVYEIEDRKRGPFRKFIGCGDQNGGVYLGEVPKKAYIVSSAFDTKSSDAAYGNINWNVDLNDGDCQIFVRTFDDSNEVTEWDGIWDWKSDIPTDAAVNGGELDENIHVNRGEQFIQYMAVLSTGIFGETPVLDWIDIEVGNLGYDSLLPEKEVYVIPNPVIGDSFEISYGLSEDADVTATLYDIKGREVGLWGTHGDAFEKNDPISAYVGSVAPGVYILHVEAKTASGETDTVVKKVAVLK